ncbi:MAG: DUF4252 domain-containing protein [Bacteroidales bacterium]|nr:DUF4252 domain-containing protein [Bacteroidales bacterium]
MKKTFILMCMLAVAQLGMAQVSVQEFLDKYVTVENATVQKIDGEMIETIKQQAPDQADFLEEMGIEEIEVLVLDDNVEQAIKDEFANDLSTLSDEDFEELVSLTHEGNSVKVLMNEIENFVKRLLVAVCDDNDCVLVNIIGDIPREKLEELMNNGNMFNFNNKSLKELQEEAAAQAE